MAPNTTCRACLRSLTSRKSPIVSAPRTTLFRTSIFAPLSLRSPRNFTTSYRRCLAPGRDQPAEFPGQPQPTSHETPVVRFAKGLRKRAGLQTETYVAYGGTQQLFKECSKHAAYTIPQASEKDGVIPKTAEEEDLGVGEGWWHDELGLPPTFSTWTHVTFLYMYLLTTRLRHFPPAIAPQWHQHLTDHFFSHAEELMVTTHLIHSGSIRSRYLKDLFTQWRGVLVSYDEGIVKGDATLAAAIWRNVFKGRDDVDAKALAQIVAWMRRELVRLQEADDLDIGSGAWEFGSPKDEAGGVMVESRLMREGADAPLE